MSKHIRFMLLAATAAMLSACQTTGGADSNSISATEAAGGKQITGAELTAMNAEQRTTRWTSPRASGTSTYKPDGSVVIDWGDGPRAGRWRVAGDGLCTLYEDLRNGAERCFLIYRMPDGTRRSYRADTLAYNSTTKAS